MISFLKNIMKKKKFKIRETTRFVFRTNSNEVNSANDTTKTDPTTTTTTTTGIYQR